MATSGQNLLTLLESDALTAFAGPLLTFLTNFSAAQGDTLKIGAAWVQLQGNLVQATPAAVAGLEAQVAQLLAAKIVAAQASVAAAKAA